ncbi:uncharacterized protein MOCS2 isoform 1-T2 [Cyanocitta cristata]
MRAGLRVPLNIRLVKVPSPKPQPEFWGKAAASPTFATHPSGTGAGAARPDSASGASPLPARPQGAVRARRRSPGRRRRRGPAAEGSLPRDGGSMRCQVSVLYFARSAELAGLRCETLSVPREITSLQLWEEIVKAHPRSTCFLEISSWSCSLETRLPSSHRLVEAEPVQVLLGNLMTGFYSKK